MDAVNLLRAGVAGALASIAGSLLFDLDPTAWLGSLAKRETAGRIVAAAFAGAIGGMILAMAVPLLRQAALRSGLREAALNLPVVGTLNIVLDDAHRRAAWHIYVELATRIATHSLYETGARGRVLSTGRIGVALASLYTVFGLVRDEMKAAGPTPGGIMEARPLESLAERLLNTELRPCLARWHPMHEEWKEAGKAEGEWPLAGLCRLDLEATRLRVLDYAIGFGQIAGVHDTMLARHREGYREAVERWRHMVREIAPESETGDEPVLLPSGYLAARATTEEQASSGQSHDNK